MGPRFSHALPRPLRRRTLARMSSVTDPASAALEAIVNRYANMVRAVGHRHGLVDADLDEVMQEVRIRLWRARSTPEKISTSSASYVYRTACTAAIDVIRRRRARSEDHVSLDAPSTNPGPMDVLAPDRVLERAELADMLGETITELSESRRPVVRMYLVGYSREEIADLLGWSEAKTRNLLYRGLDDLRNGLRLRGIGPEGTI